MGIFKNRIVKLVVKLSISLGFVAWLVFKIDWPEVVFYLKAIDLWKLGVYAVMILIGIAISAHKWKILADSKGINCRFGDYFRLYLTGTFINNFMPSFIGGDTFRAYQIGKTEKKYIEAASSVMADRITGFVGMTILALVFGLLNFKKTSGSNLLMLVNALLVLSLFLDVIIAKTRNMRLWKNFLDRLPQKIARFIIEVQSYSDNPKVLTKTILFGVAFQFFGVAAANFILFWALGISINPLDYLSVIFLISLISSIPISINNIGVKEWAYVTFFGLFGLNASAVVTAAILSRVIQMIISFAALPAYMKNRLKNNL